MTLVALMITLALSAQSDGTAGFGHFEGRARTEWLDDGTTMRLLEDFCYIDQRGEKWFAQKDLIVDGASIPRPLWPLIGGPFEGRYRNASVPHDAACDERKRDWRAVHRMFYNACRCGGVGELKAKIMFAGAYHFGPRWGIDQGVRTFAPTTFCEMQEDFLRMKLLIEESPKIGLEEIERLTRGTLRERVSEERVQAAFRELLLERAFQRK